MSSKTFKFKVNAISTAYDFLSTSETMLLPTIKKTMLAA